MLEIRRASESDSRDLWDWRNDPATRAASLASDVVNWDDHTMWFNRAITDPLRAIYIGQAQADFASSVGMCRFDVDPQLSTAEVSINLNPDHRGKKLSKHLLLESVRKFRDDFPSVTQVTALIKESNIPSKKLFLAAGFAPVSVTDEVGSYALVLAD